MFSIADNLESVRQRIQKSTNSAGRKSESVCLLPVTKTRSAEVLKTAYDLGIRDFGENYLNEALDKQEALKSLLTPTQFSQISWHFIGPIQSNKTRAIAASFDWVQSLDRIKIAQRLNDQRPEAASPLNVLIQVNINDEESKSGISLAHLDAMIEAIGKLPNLTLRGLMTIPRAEQSADQLASSFELMQRHFTDLARKIPSVDTLSMGMSGDIEQAIEHGSTMVRVGTALFGPRPPTI